MAMKNESQLATDYIDYTDYIYYDVGQLTGFGTLYNLSEGQEKETVSIVDIDGKPIKETTERKRIGFY